MISDGISTVLISRNSHSKTPSPQVYIFVSHTYNSRHHNQSVKHRQMMMVSFICFYSFDKNTYQKLQSRIFNRHLQCQKLTKNAILKLLNRQEFEKSTLLIYI